MWVWRGSASDSAPDDDWLLPFGWRGRRAHGLPRARVAGRGGVGACCVATRASGARRSKRRSTTLCPSATICRAICWRGEGWNVDSAETELKSEW